MSFYVLSLSPDHRQFPKHGIIVDSLPVFQFANRSHAENDTGSKHVQLADYFFPGWNTLKSFRLGGFLSGIAASGSGFTSPGEPEMSWWCPRWQPAFVRAVGLPVRALGFVRWLLHGGRLAFGARIWRVRWIGGAALRELPEGQRLRWFGGRGSSGFWLRGCVACSRSARVRAGAPHAH